MRLLLLLLAVALCAGCHTTTYTTKAPQGGQSSDQTASFFIRGLVGTTTIDLHAICPQGVSSFQDQETVTDGLLGCLTIGIFSPRTVTVHCAAGRTAILVPHPEENFTEVRVIADAGGAR